MYVLVAKLFIKDNFEEQKSNHAYTYAISNNKQKEWKVIVRMKGFNTCAIRKRRSMPDA